MYADTLVDVGGLHDLSDLEFCITALRLHQIQLNLIAFFCSGG